jgi:hypothetical protein
VLSNGSVLPGAISRALLIGLALPAIGTGQAGEPARPTVAVVQLENSDKRLRYLATAQIWADPGDVTPQALTAGPPLRDRSGVATALDGRPFPCTFAEAGKKLGGNTLKFSCITVTGQAIRVKYTDGSRNGNREVFSEVAASRLLWALGFHVDPVYPIVLDCRDCPNDPMSGSGPTARRSYLAIYQPAIVEPVMVTGSKQDQGWRWGELDRAIEMLPAGELRSRQRQHFDALTLLGVFLQHGDRKPEQQRLGCLGMLNLDAGEFRARGDEQERGGLFLERPGTTACELSDVTLQDTGATFGGAGRTTSASTAKMNLKSWSSRQVFQPVAAGVQRGEAAECRGQLTVSIAAGEGSLANPRIGEAGRAFLLDRLHRLSDDHLRAIFTAARVDQMSEPLIWRDPASAVVHTGTDAWVAAFKNKVQQIESRTCAP